MEQLDFSRSDILGCYIHADGLVAAHPVAGSVPIGLVFDFDRLTGEICVIALTDTECGRAHCPVELPVSDRALERIAGNGVRWQVAEIWHWETLLVDVCHCALQEKRSPYGHLEGYYFDAAKANETLAPIGIDVQHCIYWTATVEPNGNAELVGWGEISEEPMPYTDEELADAEVDQKLRMVGRMKAIYKRQEN